MLDNEAPVEVSSPPTSTEWVKPPSCASCPRSSARLVPPVIRPGASFLLVGEAPGKTENELGEPFVGGSGRVLWKLLSEAGIGRSEASVTNTVLCYLPDNPTPTAEEIKCCAPLLERAIQQAQPKMVLAIGSTAMSRLIGEGSVVAWRGSLCKRPADLTVGNTTVFGPEVYKSGKRKGEPKPHAEEVRLEQPAGQEVLVTLHPADLMRSGFEDAPLVLADLRRARMRVEGFQLESPRVEPVYEASVFEVSDFLNQQDRLVLDVETDGKGGPLTILGFGNDKRVFSLPKNPWLLELLDRWVGDESNLLINHNVLFDVGVLESEGLRVRARLWDTMHAAHFERPDLPKALDKVASRIPGLNYYNWKQAFREHMHFDVQRYNALDVGWTALLYKHLEIRLAGTKRLKHFEEVLMPLLPVLYEMEQVGVRVDEERLGQLALKQEEALQQLRAQWEQLTGGVNPESNPELHKYFYETLGLKAKIKKGTDRKTLDKKALAALFREYPQYEALSLLGKLRHVGKILSTYLRPELDPLGRLHPQYNLSGTATGRLSGGGEEGFNFQNIPRAGAKCPTGHETCQCPHIRQVFLPEEGERVVLGDWSQIEARLTALLSGEKWLIEAFQREGFDLHEETARALGITRDLGKKINHLTNYLGGIGKIAEETGCTVQEAQVFIARYQARYPAICRQRLSWIDQARRMGWVNNPFGRRGYFKATDKGKVDGPAVVAFVPQSTAADMMLKALLDAHRAGLKVRWTVHDELGVSGGEREAEALRDIMEQPFKELRGFACPVDVSLGENWAEAKEK